MGIEWLPIGIAIGSASAGASDLPVWAAIVGWIVIIILVFAILRED